MGGLGGLKQWAKCYALGLGLALCVSTPLAALKTAAGGGPKGKNGFEGVVDFIDNIVTYGVWVVVALAVLGLLAGFGKFAVGDEDGTTWMVRAVIGLAGGLLIKGIAA